MTGLEAQNIASVSWSAGSCQVHFAFVETGEIQPRLGEFLCTAKGAPQPPIRSAAQ